MVACNHRIYSYEGVSFLELLLSREGEVNVRNPQLLVYLTCISVVKLPRMYGNNYQQFAALNLVSSAVHLAIRVTKLLPQYDHE